MFGIALGMRPSDFKHLSAHPKTVAVGLGSQFLLLPALTALLIYLLRPDPAIAMGMLLVAACPGGNVSNFISLLARARIALSVSLTACATLLCPVLTPVNFRFWASVLPDTHELFERFAIDFASVAQSVAIVLLIPIALGMGLRALAPRLSAIIEKPVKWLSFAILMAFIVLAIFNNLGAFRAHLLEVFFLVLIHNALAFAAAYYSAYASGLEEPDRRSISIETGIQNSGLGLIIIFTYFGGNGGMALVAAWWGVWHILAGLLLARFFALRDLRLQAE